MADIERAAVDTSAIKGIPIIWIMGKTEILFKLLSKVRTEMSPSATLLFKIYYKISHTPRL